MKGQEMKKKILAMLSVVVLLCTGVSAAAAQPATVNTPGNGFAMGVKPYYWQICVANGYGPTAGGPVSGWNYPGRQLQVALRNRCYEDYSITNRMTVDSVNNAGACIQYSNTGKLPTQQQHWGPYYWIWDENPVVWVNVRSGCNGPGQIEHNIAKGVGYILGLQYSTCSGADACVMGPDDNLVTRPTNGDSIDTDQIYHL